MDAFSSVALLIILLISVNVIIYIGEKQKAKKTMAEFLLPDRHESMPIKENGSRFFSRKNYFQTAFTVLRSEADQKVAGI